jgi:hypothetical protein
MYFRKIESDPKANKEHNDLMKERAAARAKHRKDKKVAK